jgi:transposase
MAKKKLTDQHIKEMTQMVTQGKTPDEISKHFKIAVSSVHNYKRELRKKGVDVPDVKGKRPGDPFQRKVVKAITSTALPVKKSLSLIHI